MSAVAGSRKILIVDDEPMLARTLQLVFLGRGYDARVAHSAEEAMKLLLEWTPGLAILDVMLPRMNGIDLAIVLQSEYPECRLLLLSGHPGTSALLDDARAQGHSFEILAKPLHPTYILDTVAHLLPGPPAAAEA